MLMEAVGMGYKDKEYDKKMENSSEGLFHQYQPRDRENGMQGLLQVRQEQNEEDRMQEIFHMGNAYGNIALGANEKGEYTFLVNKVKNIEGTSVQQRQRELNQQNSKAWNSWKGKLQLNQGDNKEGAAAFRIHEGIYPAQILQEMKKLSDAQNQNTLREFLPFRESDGLQQIEKQDRQSAERGDPSSVRKEFWKKAEKAKRSQSKKAALWNTMNRDMYWALMQRIKKNKANYMEKYF